MKTESGKTVPKSRISILNPQYILGLDVGTSSVRAALFDCRGEHVPETLVKRERRLKSTKGGGFEIDAEKSLTQVADVIDEVLARPQSAGAEISFVAASSFWHSLVGIDAEGNPTTKVFGWADNQSRNYVKPLRRRFNETEIHNRTGARFHSSYWPSKLLWLRKEFPVVWRNTDCWLSFSDYMAMKFFASPITTISMASGTGIFDIRKCLWDAEMLHFLKLRPDNLPEIAVSDAAAFKLTAKFAKRWPQLRDADWFPAIGDGAANNIGSGCIGRSRAALMVGTSGAMRVAYVGKPPEKIPPGLWCYRIDRRRVIIGGALSDGGGLYQWLRENLRLDENAEAEIAKRPPAGHGLVFLPFLSGERGTGYNEDAAGAIIGIKTATDAIDIMQAAMESVAYRFAEIFGQLNRNCRIGEIAASGGALHASPVWTQIIADVLGRDLIISPEPEASLRGAVLLVLESIGKIGVIENIRSASGSNIAYHPECHALYKVARKQHRRSYDQESAKLK